MRAPVMVETRVPSFPEVVIGRLTARALVDVAVVTVIVFQRLHVFGCCFGVEMALFRDDRMEGSVYVFGHAGGVAADVDAGSILQP